MKSKITSKHHLEILVELKKHVDQGTKHQQEREQRYIGTTKFCYTISSLVKRQIIKEWLKKHPQLSFQEYVSLINSLFRGESHDEISLAGKLLKLLPKLRGKIDPSLLSDWLDYVEGWAEVDSICQSNFSAEEILGKWKEWRDLLVKLSKDGNVHKRRASLVLLTGPVRQSFDPRLAQLSFTNIHRLKSEKDILVTKAISWLLRDLIKNHRQRVQLYLDENQTTLPKIALRETNRKLLTGKK